MNRTLCGGSRNCVSISTRQFGRFGDSYKQFRKKVAEHLDGRFPIAISSPFVGDGRELQFQSWAHFREWASTAETSLLVFATRVITAQGAQIVEGRSRGSGKRSAPQVEPITIGESRSVGRPRNQAQQDLNAFSVRSRAHEYGGGSFAISDGVVYFSNNLDQRLYRQDAARPPSPITPAPGTAAADALRYADGVIDRRRGRIVCVREDHTGAGEATTALVGVSISGVTAPQVLVSGNDFYSTPRLNPNGSRMSWLTWRHPDMPWVATEAWVADILPDGTIGNARRVAGGPDESVFQPE
jgi:hypothetical protein